MKMFSRLHAGIAPALLAALLFGASTPLAKLLVRDVHPVLLAGLLYAGSGLGLGTWWLMRRWRNATTAERRCRRPAVAWRSGVGRWRHWARVADAGPCEHAGLLRVAAAQPGKRAD
jgi:hypothetical protein